MQGEKKGKPRGPQALAGQEGVALPLLPGDAGRGALLRVSQGRCLGQIEFEDHEGGGGLLTVRIFQNTCGLEV